jgi:hypothetical protein
LLLNEFDLLTDGATGKNLIKGQFWYLLRSFQDVVVLFELESAYRKNLRSSRVEVVRSSSKTQNKGLPKKFVESHRVSEHKSISFINDYQFVRFPLVKAHSKVVIHLVLFFSKKKPVELEFLSVTLHQMLVWKDEMNFSDKFANKGDSSCSGHNSSLALSRRNHTKLTLFFTAELADTVLG